MAMGEAKGLKTVEYRLQISLLIALIGMEAGAAQFVDVTAEIQTVYWINGYKERPATVQVMNWTTHCVVGTNEWLIEQQCGECTRDAWWFTGSNVITRSVIVKYPSDRPELFAKNHSELVIGRAYSITNDFYDGKVSPAPAVVCGQGWKTAQVNIPWLAFCSGPYLKHEGNALQPPSSDSQTTLYDWPWNSATVAFDDSLGLPKSFEFSRTDQPICHYRTVGSTNVLGWNFPLEFHLVQYRKNFETHGWEVHLTASGRITGIGIGTEPGFETQVSWKRSKKLSIAE